MKFFPNQRLLTPLFVLFFIKAEAQLIWTIPAFPTQTDDVTVYFDASQGNGALAGFQGDVYAHTGVITTASTNGNDWKHVVGNWGTADSRVLMTRVQGDIYSISYNITDFYGVPGNEEVLKLAFVFRNVSGTMVGRSADGSDIFTPVFPVGQGLSLTLLSPAGSDIIIDQGDSIFVDVSASDTVSFVISDNNDVVYLGMGERAQFYLHPDTSGQHVIHIEATKDTTVNLEKDFFVLDSLPILINPPVGSRYGLNYFTDSTYLFQINAPLKKYVFLLCPANHYKTNADFQMHQAEDGHTFWIELPRGRFNNGKNTYQYLMNDGVKVADPLSEVVLDPNNDQWINPNVMSTLPPYPSGMTTGIVTAFDEKYDPYPFAITDFTKPAKTNLVIYELLIRDFVADHSYTSMLDTLEYFKRLGVTAIELMPVSEYEGNDSWGYNQSFHMALDKYYGTRNQLKKFIDAAHERGIAVILDVVFNHSFGQGPLVQMYWDAVNSRPAANSPYLNAIPKHPFNVGYDFNHESPYTKTWVKQILSYWLTEFKFDGFRFDLSKGLTQFNSGNDAGLMAKYDASRIAILNEYAHQIWSVDSTAYVILEHFADNNEEVELSNNGMMLWGNMNYQFNQAAKGFQSDLEGVDYTFRGWNDAHLVGYMESHDEERLMYRLIHEGSSSGDYNTKELNTALERVAAASVIFYSIPGPKMIWEFGEMGYDYSINTCSNGTVNNNCRLDAKPIRWDYLQNPNRERLRQVTSDMIYLRNTYPTFRTKDFVFEDGNFYVKLVHLNDPDMDATTIANFRVTSSDIIPKFQYPGTWYEYFTGDSIVVTDTEKRITFLPGEYRIYTSKRIMPQNGFISGTHDLVAQDLAIYPNFITEGDEIFGYLPADSQVKSITLTDMSGRQLLIHDFRADADGFRINMPAEVTYGMYVLNIQTDLGYYVAKIIRQ